MGFSKAETRFQTRDGRLEIAGRERAIIGWLNDRNEDCAKAVLQPKAEDQERAPEFWEVYDQRRRMKRLSEFVRSELLVFVQMSEFELLSNYYYK